ncbi:multidrug ABC transporter ATP-binding protein [Jeotgalibacillus alimentarius]|uniref:Multidrug ABC transporter ATP-binding protein n=1 Tax=Jeotgalibacillus alimentarius TaxID=135826 RepID=A0A0C2RZQ3_9BACL|nr:ABC transporter ATP-binding protein [Jeotgalibacillus alimentarius]KIL47294.1 multidrug ABC transporter ATP-binding protein [Jeotgalibacillus alimentarius]
MLKVQIQSGSYIPNQSTIQHIHFQLHPGELLVMIGSNGAGKSTTLKAIMGQLPFLEGEVVFQKNIRYSFIPERPVFYDELTLQEHLQFIADIEELPEAEWKPRAKMWLEKFQLMKVIHELPGTFSKGMQQKAMLLLALLTKPSLWIIDEPFMGLDPSAVKLFMKLIEEERKRGAGILMCTHVLDTAEKIGDRFVIIAEGTVSAHGTLEEVLSQHGAADLYGCIPEAE